MFADRVIDLTPSISILLNAGALDYTLNTALAELIDNAIQYSKDSPARVVSVRFRPDPGVCHGCCCCLRSVSTGMDADRHTVAVLRSGWRLSIRAPA